MRDSTRKRLMNDNSIDEPRTSQKEPSEVENAPFPQHMLQKLETEGVRSGKQEASI